MKAIAGHFVLLCFVTLCYGASQPVIENTRFEECIDGACTSPICSWEGVEISPGDSFNQPGECRLLECNSDFDIYIIPCPSDINGKYEWVGRDESKLYPECCGQKTLKSVQRTRLKFIRHY